MVRILPVVFGLFVVFDSLGRLQNALELRRCGYPSWKWFILLAPAQRGTGGIMIFDPFGAMETLVMGIGIILLIEGAFNLGGAIYTPWPSGASTSCTPPPSPPWNRSPAWT